MLQRLLPKMEYNQMPTRWQWPASPNSANNVELIMGAPTFVPAPEVPPEIPPGVNLGDSIQDSLLLQHGALSILRLLSTLGKQCRAINVTPSALANVAVGCCQHG